MNPACHASREPAQPAAEDFTIRRAAPDDLPAIRAVLLAVRGEHGVVDETNSSDGDLDHLEENYFRRGGTFLVILENPTRRIVGCAALRPLNPQRAELCKMYIERAARGQGLGKRLLESLLQVARRNGFAEVWLETNSVLTVATSLYRKYGFEPVPPEDLLPRCDEAYLLRLT
jgi:putative acetyltransferase